MKKAFLLIFVIFGTCQLSAKTTIPPGPENEIKDLEIVVKGEIDEVKKFLSTKKFQLADIEVVDQENQIYLIKIISRNKSILGPEKEKLINELSQSPGIDFAEPNFKITIKEIPSPKDPMWISQWGLSNIGQDSPSGSQGEKGADIGALTAWEISKGSKDIIVAVVDTGIDYNHPDLKDNMWVNQKEKDGIPGVDDDGNGYVDDVYGWNFVSAGRTAPYYGQIGHPDPYDDNMHGTHCAGIIGANGNNFKGVSGVNWKVSLMALKFLDKNGSGTNTDGYRAIMYAIKNGVHIISASWGSSSDSHLHEFALEKAMEAGVLFVAAAGNESANNDYSPSFPANSPQKNIISVAATDNKDQLAYFSNFGINKVHVAAPGVDIFSTVPVDQDGSEATAYGSLSGTSMATPFVAGAAALLMSSDPGLIRNPELVKNILMKSADIRPQLVGKIASGGRINLFRALKKDLNFPLENNKIISEDVNILSPSFNRELFDNTWKIFRPNGKKIRIHFSSVMGDLEMVDLISIYDQNYKLIQKFETSHPEGLYTPWIEGNTIYVRFANSWVLIKNYKEVEFSSVEEGYYAGAVICYEKENGKFSCSMEELSNPFGNFESEGFHIDKVEYQVDEAAKNLKNRIIR